MWKRKVFDTWKKRMEKENEENTWKKINIWSKEERKKEENIWFAGEVGNRKGGKRKRKISFFVEEKENLWRRIIIDYVSRQPIDGMNFEQYAFS